MNLQITMGHAIIRKIVREIVTMEIRFATAADLPQILKYDRHIQKPVLADCVQRSLLDVLCDNSKIVGVLRYNLFWQSIPFLDLIFIDEAYRSLGWGSKMMAHWEGNMARMGYDYAMLSTQEDETAKVFYEKLGYRRIGAFLPPEQEADEIMYLKELK
jgi:GNAT superfamily N-acetyltransferase